MATQTLPLAPSTPKRLFPLYFSPIESLFVADDRPDYPMAFILHFTFSGTMDRPAFEAAMAVALDRHPLLRSHRQVAKRGLPCWVLTDDTKPMVDWGQLGDPIEFPRGESIDLAQEVGLRIWIRIGSDRTVMTMQFHHSCCDGIGGYRFVGDLLAAYGRQTGNDPSSYELAPVDPALLRNRKMRMTELAYRSRRRQLFKRCMREVYKIFWGKVAPLAPPARSPATDDRASYPGIVVTTFDREEHRRLLDAATKSDVAINDLLIAALFSTMRDWNIQNKAREKSSKLRIMMPTDMRETADFPMPAANIVSYTFITRGMRDSYERDPLISSVVQDTTRIKNERQGLAFGDTISEGTRRRWMLPLLISGKRCLATAVLSNAGDPTKRFTAKLPRDNGRVVAGNLVLEEFIGVPPLRIRTHVTISIITYLRKLTICMRCCPRQFGVSDTRRLSEMYAQSIRKLAGE